MTLRVGNNAIGYNKGVIMTEFEQLMEGQERFDENSYCAIKKAVTVGSPLFKALASDNQYAWMQVNEWNRKHQNECDESRFWSEVYQISRDEKPMEWKINDRMICQRQQEEAHYYTNPVTYTLHAHKGDIVTYLGYEFVGGEDDTKRMKRHRWYNPSQLIEFTTYYRRTGKDQDFIRLENLPPHPIKGTFV